MTPQQWTFRTPSQLARAALRELTDLVLAQAADAASAVRDIASMTDAEVRAEIKSWIDDAQDVPEWRRVLAAYGF